MLNSSQKMRICANNIIGQGANSHRKVHITMPTNFNYKSYTASLACKSSSIRKKSKSTHCACMFNSSFI